MKKLAFFFTLLFVTNSHHIYSQPKYFTNAIKWNDYYTQEFRKAIPLNNTYTLLVGNIYPDFPGYWQNGYCYMDKFGNCTPVVTFANPTIGDLGNFDAYTNSNLVLLVGLLTPDWDTTTSQAYIQRVNMSDNSYEIIQLSNYPSSIRTLHPCDDGGYLLAGRANPNYPNSPQWLEMYAVKLNSQFDVEWERIYDDLGYYYDNYLTDILPAPDGSGYYLLGTVNFYFNTIASVAHGQIAVLHVNNTGEVIEQFILDPPGNVAMQSTNIISTQDGGFLLTPAGVALDEWNYIGSYVKLSNNFDIEWMSYASVNSYILHYGGCGNAVSLPDGSFIVGGCLGSTANLWYDAFIGKLDENGTPLWSRRYGGSYSDYCYDMTATPDGGYLMVGRQDTLAGAFAYIVKTNCMGLLTVPQADFTFTTDSAAMSATFFNQSLYTYPDSIDGGHFIWNFDDGTPPYQTKEPIPLTHLYTQAGTYYVTLYAITCTDTSVFQTIVKPQSGWGTAVGIQTALNSPPVAGLGVVVYPNPAQNTLTFQRVSKSPLGDLGVRLLSLTGQTVLQTTLAAGQTSRTISVAQLPVGLYLYIVSGDTDNGNNGGGAVLARGKVAVMR